MNNISLDLSKCESFIDGDKFEPFNQKVKDADGMISKKSGAGNEFLGWLDLPSRISNEEVDHIISTATRVRDNCDVFLVIGIGGSYLGARAVIEALKPNFYNQLKKSSRGCPEIYFLGQNLSESYISDLFDLIKDKDIVVNVISKSGTTTEPAIAFRLVRELLIKKYGDDISDRIIATTDAESGALHDMAAKYSCETFSISSDIGGRFSVLSSVGLLPIAVAGIDISELLSGAKDGIEEYSVPDIHQNPAYLYAAIRNYLYQSGFTNEIMADYNPKLHYFIEWWKQLFGESEGKDNKGIFPVSAEFTTDLHSLGQYIQDGKRNIFETVLNFSQEDRGLIINEDNDNLDRLNYLSGKSISDVNSAAIEATMKAHYEGGVPVVNIENVELNTYSIGKLIYFFEKACAASAYILGVNPFNQPGVENYKKNMFKILGKE